MERKPTSCWTILGGVTLLCLVLLSVYIIGYFALSQTVIAKGRVRTRLRDYPYGFLATAFRPCARIESAITGENVDTDCMRDFWQAIEAAE